MREFQIWFALMYSRALQRMSTKTRVLAYVLEFYGLKHRFKKCFIPVFPLKLIFASCIWTCL